MVSAAPDLDLTLHGPDLIGVLETTALVVAAARSVTLAPTAVARAADLLALKSTGGQLAVPPWDKH